MSRATNGTRRGPQHSAIYEAPRGVASYYVVQVVAICSKALGAGTEPVPCFGFFYSDA